MSRTRQNARLLADAERRARRVYGAAQGEGRKFEGFDPDKPVEGYYSMPLVSGGVLVGIRIWHGPPRDPVTGEVLDRSWRWQATANGREIDLQRVWPVCAKRPITEAEHDYLVRQQAWGEQHDPDGAIANPSMRLDPLKAPVTF